MTYMSHSLGQISESPIEVSFIAINNTKIQNSNLNSELITLNSEILEIVAVQL